MWLTFGLDVGLQDDSRYGDDRDRGRDGERGRDYEYDANQEPWLGERGNRSELNTPTSYESIGTDYVHDFGLFH